MMDQQDDITVTGTKERGLSCPMCTHNMRRYKDVPTAAGNCKSLAGFPGIPNVIQHLIRDHLRLCRVCKEAIQLEDGTKVRSQRMFTRARECHVRVGCQLRDWKVGEEEKNPEILTEKQEQVVLRFSSREQQKLLEQKMTKKQMWEFLYGALHPEARTNIPPADLSYYVPRYELDELRLSQCQLDGYLAGFLIEPGRNNAILNTFEPESPADELDLDIQPVQGTFLDPVADRDKEDVTKMKEILMEGLRGQTRTLGDVEYSDSGFFSLSKCHKTDDADLEDSVMEDAFMGFCGTREGSDDFHADRAD